MAFFFRLEKVLELRKQRETEELRKLGELETELARVKARRQHLLAEQARAEDEFRTLQKVGGSVHAWQLYYQHLALIRVEISDAESEVEVCTLKVSEQRQVLAAAVKERKALEKLKEKRIEEYRFEEIRKEQNTIDDIAGQVFRWQREDDEWER